MVPGGVPGRSCSWPFVFVVVRRSAAVYPCSRLSMQMSSMIVRSWFVVPGGVRGHSDVINDSQL